MAVTRKHGRAVWNEVQMPVLTESLSTGTHVLSRHQGDPWMQNERTVTGAWLDYTGGECLGSTSLLSTGSVHASMTVERTHPTGQAEHRFRYYRYLLVQLADGRVMQAGPDKALPFGHRLPVRPAHLDALYVKSTSTGW